MENINNKLKNSRKSVTVIGGGIGGLYSALKLCECGFSVTLIEKQNSVGGLSTSIPIDGYKIDIGPHYMTLKKESEITNEILELVGQENIIILNNIEKSYLSYYNNKLLNTVPTILDAIFSSGSKSALISAFSLISKPRIRFNDKNISSIEYLKACFGNFLFEKWCKPYLLQNYGNLELPLEYVKNRFKPITLNKISTRLSNNRNAEDELKIKTTDQKYINCYFKFGVGQLADVLSQKIKNLDGSIILNAEITSIEHSQSKTIHYKVNDEKHSINADYIIYATPPGITKKWFNTSQNIRSDNVRNKNFNAIMVFLFIDTPKLFDGWLISVFDSTLPFFRLSQQNYLSKDISPKNKTLLTAEIRSEDTDQLWQKDEKEIAKIVEKNLREMNLLNDNKIEGHKVIKFPNLYPRFKSNISEEIANLEDEICKTTTNEFLLGVSELDTGRFVTTEQRVNEDHVPSAGGIYNAISNGKKVVELITTKNSGVKK